MIQRFNPSIFGENIYNKYLTHQFLENNDTISGKSAAQILSLNLA